MKIEGAVQTVLLEMVRSTPYKKAFIAFAESSFSVVDDKLRVKCLFKDFQTVSKITSRPFQYVYQMKFDYSDFIRRMREHKIKRILEDEC